MSSRSRTGATVPFPSPNAGWLTLFGRMACALLVQLAAHGCSSDPIVAPPLDESPVEDDRPAATDDPSPVNDLHVTATTDSSVTLAWTAVPDGAGAPAGYQLKYGVAPLEWNRASTGCRRTPEDIHVGEETWCTVQGLVEDSTYAFQVAAFGAPDGPWEGVTYSNVATADTPPRDEPTSEPPSPATRRRGIWVDRSEVMQRPTSGPAWALLLADAAHDPGRAAIADQHSDHDVYTLAAALVCVRVGQYCDKARQGVLDAIGTESGGNWLAVGRNLGAYVIAADLLDLRADGSGGSDGARVEEWLRGWLTKRLRDNIKPILRGFGPFHSSANAAAQEGFVFAAVAAYLGDHAAMQRAWDAFRTFVCDPGAPDREKINLVRSVRDGWTHEDARPCAVNPLGATKVVPPGVPGAGSLRRIDGALVGDMRRGGTFRWRPGYTQYPWVGLEGLVPAAAILERAGHPAFDVADRAVLRALDYMWFLRSSTGDLRWFDGRRARDIVHLVNTVYGSSFPVEEVVGRGRTVGYTAWTHPR